MRQILLSFILTATAAWSAPTIDTQPVSQTVLPGEAVTFTVAATASSGSLSYQWRKDGVSIPSATGTSYSPGTAQPWHIGDYSVVVSDTSGAVTSSVAALEITGVPKALWKGLVGYYPLSGNANDSTAFARNGTLSTAAPSTTTNRFSQATEAYSLNGSTNFISAAAGTPGWPAANADRTVSIWFKTAANGTASGNLFALGARASNQRFSLLWFNATQPAFIGEGSDQSYTAPGFANAQWHHCVITYGSNTGKVFMDGVKLTTPVSSWTKTLNTDGTKPFYLGVNAEQMGEYFPGSLDDARIYNRALSEAEVAQLFALEKGASLLVVGNQTLISSGDTTPDSADHTAFGSSPVGTPVTRTFTIQNPNPALYIGLSTVTISGTGAAAFSISSAPEGGGIMPGGSVTMGITFQPAAPGVFDAVVTIPNGSAATPSYTFAIRGDTLSPPAITTQPQAVTTSSGQAAAFAVTATGDALSYQWFKDGVAIPGAIAATYSLTSVQAWHIGSYTVQVSNTKGSVTSDSAALTLTGVDSTLWSGLVGYYPLDGNANDATAFARHGTITGATAAIGRDGQAAKAYAFSGSSQYITAAAGSTGWPGGNSSRTVSLWYNANAHSGNLFSFGQNTTNRRFSILLQGSSQTSFIGGFNHFAYSTGTQAGGGWHHLVITYGDGGTGIGKVFIDGVQLTNPAASWTKANLDTDGTQPFQLGTVAGATGEFLNGSLDDVRIYNRALTAAEAGNLYMQELGSGLTVSGNGQNISVQDSSPSTVDGTDFESVFADGLHNLSRTFTLTNTGAPPLVLTGAPLVVISGADAASFTLSTPPEVNIPAGGSTAFSITFTPGSAGLKSATLSIATGATSFDFAIQGLGAAIGWPDRGNPGANNQVLAIATQADGKTLVGGLFTTFGGQPRTYLARLNADDTLDSSFHPVLTGPSSGGALGSPGVICCAVQSDGKILIGGAFDSVDGVTRNCLARLEADGTLDMTYNPDVRWYDDASQPFVNVAGIALQPDGKSLVWGGLRKVGGQIRNSGFARIHVDGTLDTSFDVTTNSEIYSAAVQHDGSILIAGGFISVQGVQRARMARLYPDGSLDMTFAPGFNGFVYSVAVQNDGKILAAGNFTQVQGTQRLYVARIEADGSLDQSFVDSGISFVSSSSFIYGIVPQGDGKVLIRGTPDFRLRSSPRGGVARLNADGTADSFAPSVTPTSVDMMALAPDGSVLLGGSFTSLTPMSAGNVSVSRPRFARIHNATSVQTLSPLTPRQLIWSRTGPVPLLQDVTFELSTDGGATFTPLPGTPTPTGAAGWQLTGLSLPESGILRGRGRTTSGGTLGTSASIIVQTTAFTGLTAPHVTLLGNGLPIASGDTTPAALDHTDFGNSAGGTAISRTFTLQNTGTMPLLLTNSPPVTLGGAGASHFAIVTPPATSIAPGSSSTFMVEFTPPTSGVRSATLTIANNDLDVPLYAFTIRSARLSSTTDTDSDGLNDGAEYQMAALGFDWEVNQTALVQTLTDNAATAGLYSLTQVQQLNVGTPVLVRNNATGTFKLTFGLQQSNNLTNFTPMPFTSGTTTINGSGQIEFEFTPGNGSPHFYRVGAQ